MNEAIAPMQIVWAEPGGHDPSGRFVTPPRGWKAQGTPWSADSTKPGFWGLGSHGFTGISGAKGSPHPNLFLHWAHPNQLITVEEA